MPAVVARRLKRSTARDVDGIFALVAEGGTIEDLVGSDVEPA